MSAPQKPKGVCRDCRYAHTFSARPDERKRYGFGEVGYGCRYPGYEGYTQADATCPSFREAASLAQRSSGE